MPWASGDTLDSATLNLRQASASSFTGFSTNTLRPESGVSIRIPGGLSLLFGDALPSQITLFDSSARIMMSGVTEATLWASGTALQEVRFISSASTDNRMWRLRWGVGSENRQAEISLDEDDFGGTSGRVFLAMRDGSNLSWLQIGTNSNGVLIVGDSLPEGRAKLQVSGSTVRVMASFTPTSGIASGTTGDIVWDSSFVYVCTSSNSWRRATLSTF